MIPACAPHHLSATTCKDKCAGAWLGLLALCLLMREAGAVDYMLEEQLHARLQRAEQGDVTAQYAVGDMYFNGMKLALSGYSRRRQKNVTPRPSSIWARCTPWGSAWSRAEIGR